MDNRTFEQRESGALKRRLFFDKFFSTMVLIISFISTAPLFLILYELVIRGISQINFNFFVKSAPDSDHAIMAVMYGEAIPGGIANGIVGTLVIVVITGIMAIPFGVLVGIYLSENKKDKIANAVRFIVDMLQGVPSIVLGMIGYMWVVKPITGGFSGFAAALALAIMMLPSIIRSTEETLNMIPGTLKEASLSLGVPYHRTMLKVVVPTGMSGILSGIIIGISRIAGETAPLMLTALGSRIIQIDPSKPMSAVPLLIWEFYNDPNLVDLIWSASLLLMGLVLVLNLTAKGVARKWKVQY